MKYIYNPKFLWITPNSTFISALAARRCYSTNSLWELTQELYSKGYDYWDTLLARCYREKAFDVFEHAHAYFICDYDSEIVPGLLESYLKVSLISNNRLLISGNLRGFYNYISPTYSSLWCRATELIRYFIDTLSMKIPHLFTYTYPVSDRSLGVIPDDIGFTYIFPNGEDISLLWSTDSSEIKEEIGWNIGTSFLNKHLAMMFHITNIGRITTHQLVRHREFSYDQECFDSETEILTNKGWVQFPQLSYSDKVVTYSIEKSCIEFHCPNTIYFYHRIGSMYKVQNSDIDLLVTPNHRVFISLLSDSHENKIELCEAYNVIGKPARYWRSQISTLSNNILVENPIPFRIVNDKKQEDGWVDYNGKIYCINVPNSTLYIRRNGKEMWSGNSQRFSSAHKESLIYPPSVQGNEEAKRKFDDLYSSSNMTFLDIRDRLKIPKEDARFIMPAGLGTKLVMTGTVDAYNRMISLREKKDAQWEIRKLAQSIKKFL